MRFFLAGIKDREPLRNTSKSAEMTNIGTHLGHTSGRCAHADVHERQGYTYCTYREGYREGYIQHPGGSRRVYTAPRRV